ncbi:hypothetical protein TNCV_3739301 [Trichonephila clavipes]|nr:hypothetical protein TNCV_3739301 [Trichonephila clavipes]
MAPLVQMARKCICVLRTNRTKEAVGDFCGLPMRRDEGRVVDPPCCLKGGFLGDVRRALEGENLRRALKKRDLDGGEPRLEWKEKRDERKAGGVGELEGVFKEMSECPSEKRFELP